MQEAPIRALFNSIATCYDSLNHLFSFGLDIVWRKRAARSIDLPPDADVLDLCTGTGDLAIALAKQHESCTVYGVDLSEKMLTIAGRKVRRRGLEGRIRLLQADALNLPFADESVDAMFLGFGLRNLYDLPNGIQEMRRVLKPAAPLVILEFSPPSSSSCFGLLYHFYLSLLIPVVGRCLSKSTSAYRYLHTSIAVFLRPEEIKALFHEQGLKLYSLRCLLFGVVYLYVTRQNEAKAVKIGQDIKEEDKIVDISSLFRDEQSIPCPVQDTISISSSKRRQATMEEKSPKQQERSLFTHLRIFYRTRPILCWIVALAILAVVGVVALASGSVVGYVAFDYIWNNPKFCTTCHSPMQESYDLWAVSEHADVNCHACHLLSPEEGINYGIHLVRGLPDKVPPRPMDKIIVPSSDCMECHWEGEKEPEPMKLADMKDMDLTEMVIHSGEKVREILFKTGPDGENVAGSRFHAIHYFNGQNDCSVCHGKKELHVFSADPADCLECHQDKQEKAHAAKSVELACLNCHTDRTADLNPDREKCLSCHSDDETIRQDLLTAATIDVKKAPLDEEIIAKAVKISAPDGAPMQKLDCGTCHTPHQEEAKPTSDSCISCHPSIKDVGQHALHLNFVKNDCTACHQPHSWKMMEERVEKDCAKCHKPYESKRFIQASKKK